MNFVACVLHGMKINYHPYYQQCTFYLHLSHDKNRYTIITTFRYCEIKFTHIHLLPLCNHFIKIIFYPKLNFIYKSILMKLLFKFLCIFLFLISFIELSAQHRNSGGPILPFQPDRSPLFGQDITIHDQPDRDQRNVVMCTAFNGWIFTAYSYINSFYSAASVCILKSVDEGKTWTVFFDFYYPLQPSEFRSIDIVTTGNSLSNLKVFIAGVITNGPWNMGQGICYRFNGESGDYEDALLDDYGPYQIAIASDVFNPGVNPNPSTLGILYSKWSNNKDSVIFRSSDNGGISLTSRQVVAVTGKHFHRIALAFGKTPSWNSGRYFAAWEDHEIFDSNLGHIYTAHSEPNFSGPFSKAICLDSLNPTMNNKVRNPSIACQISDMDNDSTNLSEIVLFEQFNSENSSYDITGFYNLQTTTSGYFKPLTISTTTNIKLQPDICFNPYSSDFMLTYYDSTTQKLPFLTNNVNLANPDTWTVLNDGYNDSPSLTLPQPKIEMNNSKQSGMNVWKKGMIADSGVALFDAQYLFFTGNIINNDFNCNYNLQLYPNPCSTSITIDFELPRTEFVKINIFNPAGQNMETIKDQIFPVGKNTLHYNVMELPTGNYFLVFRAGGITLSDKFVIIR